MVFTLVDFLVGQIGQVILMKDHGLKILKFYRFRNIFIVFKFMS